MDNLLRAEYPSSVPRIHFGQLTKMPVTLAPGDLSLSSALLGHLRALTHTQTHIFLIKSLFKKGILSFLDTQ